MPIASAQEAGAPDGTDRGDDLVVDLLSDEREPAMRALAGRGDDPRAEASAKAGGRDEGQLRRAGGAPPNGPDRVGYKSMVAVGAGESTSRPPARPRRPCSSGHSPSGAARHPNISVLRWPTGATRASSNTSLTTRHRGPLRAPHTAPPQSHSPTREPPDALSGAVCFGIPRRRVGALRVCLR